MATELPDNIGHKGTTMGKQVQVQVKRPKPAKQDKADAPTVNQRIARIWFK